MELSSSLHALTAWPALVLAAGGAAALAAGGWSGRRRPVRLGLFLFFLAAPVTAIAWYSGVHAAAAAVPFSEACEAASARHGSAGRLGGALLLGWAAAALVLCGLLGVRRRVSRAAVILAALLGVAGAAGLGRAAWTGRVLEARLSGDFPEDLAPLEEPGHLVIGRSPGPYEED